MPYLVRPRVVQTGPREFVVVVYALETSGGNALEAQFASRIERTGTRARHAMDELLAQVSAALGKDAEIVVDDEQARAALARLR